MYRRAIATVALLASLTACKTTTVTSTTSPASPPAAATTTPAGSPPASTATKTGTLPNLVGMGLQSAQDTAQAAGFYNLHSHDALGRSRNQIDDRNWKVCNQTPAPGQQPSNISIDFGTVKLDEQCPATDQGAATPKAGASMPDFRGKAVSTVKDTLDKSTSYTVKDVKENRAVLVESNWQVCSQDPAPGAQLSGQPVSLKVVKFGETCP
ncbi:PASTA domain-containing protein [Kitasatospora camelliae]|uniref:PASTA domain-containing protein n=1 Tax=Kitasatospora camelliae TaxID=3156397 RepID=A0AAU8K4J1_9ACTN